MSEVTKRTDPDEQAAAQARVADVAAAARKAGVSRRENSPERPPLLLVTAILTFVAGGLLLLMGLGALFLAFAVSAIAGGSSFASTFYVVAFFLLILALAFILAGVGLLTLRAWAWSLAAALASLGILAGVILVATLGPLFGYPTLAFNLVVLVLLVFPSVKDAPYREPRAVQEAARKDTFDVMIPANPSNQRCPKCRSNRIVVASDGSGACLACRTGFHRAV